MMWLLVNLLQMTSKTILLIVLLIQYCWSNLVYCVFLTAFFLFFFVTFFVFLVFYFLVYRTISMLCIVLVMPLWRINNHTHARTHTHTYPFNGPLSGTTRVSRYQKGKTNLDFTEAGESEWQWHQLGHICKSAPRSRQIITPAHH